MSYVHEDEVVASVIKELLQHQLGVGVFLSSDAMFAGDQWLDKITRALKDAELVVLMLSQRSVRRPWVNFEAGGAWLSGRKVVPCCYGNLTADRLPHPYSTLHAAQLPRDSYKLVRSVHHQLGGVGPTPVSPFPRVDLTGKPEPQRSEREQLYLLYDVLDGTLAMFKDEPVSNP